MRGYHRNTLKVDILKPFDSINRNYLFVLEAMDFPRYFLLWPKACVTSSIFSIMIYDGLCGHFEERVSDKKIIFPLFVCFLYRNLVLFVE